VHVPADWVPPQEMSLEVDGHAGAITVVGGAGVISLILSETTSVRLVGVGDCRVYAAFDANPGGFYRCASHMTGRSPSTRSRTWRQVRASTSAMVVRQTASRSTTAGDSPVFTPVSSLAHRRVSRHLGGLPIVPPDATTAA
jgi:hypothetical protein